MGRKRITLDSNLQPNKRAKRFIGDDDRISQLPDEILVDILSVLSLKEAAQTSILSFRWINLWKHTQSLNFDAKSALDKIAAETKVLGGERRKYIKWVNSVLQSHKAATLKDFRIQFDLNGSAKEAINKWVVYSFARRVQRLEMDLLSPSDPLYSRPQNYAFPQELLTQHFHNPVVEFKSLKALLLKRVNVTSEDIEFILHNFSLLEELVVHNAQKLSNVEVCGSSLKLKHLEICHCLKVRSIKVSAPNLTSLSLTQSPRILLQNVPMLVNITVDSAHHIYVRNLIPTFSCCIPQLETLTLKLASLKDTIERERWEFPNMPKLKRLVINCGVKQYDSLIGLISWIRESPYLEEFVLKLEWCVRERERLYIEVEDTTSLPQHHHLKMVKFFGYRGRESDVELVRYFLHNCVVLEKVIVECPYRPYDHSYLYREPLVPSELTKEQLAKNRARQQLEAEVPHHVELVIL